jgi:hypothetical protein
LARLDESIAAFNQRFIFPLPFAMKIIKINLWNNGNYLFAYCPTTKLVDVYPSSSCNRLLFNPMSMYSIV